jgi:MFS family permease
MTGSTMTIMNGGGALNYLLLGFVNIFWIPAAMKIGRRFCFLVPLILCIGLSSWIGSFHTAGEWLGSNMINGLGTSAYEAVIQLVVFDLFFDHQRGRMLGVYIFAQQLGSIIGLVSGGYVADGPGWRWVQWIVAIVEAALLLIFFFTFEDTLFPRFLFSQTLPLNESKPHIQALPPPEVEDSNQEQMNSRQKRRSVALNDTNGSNDSSGAGGSIQLDFPKRTFVQKLKPWVYYPQDFTSYWTYFKRPFFLLTFPNVLLVSTIYITLGSDHRKPQSSDGYLTFDFLGRRHFCLWLHFWNCHQQYNICTSL